MRTLLTFALLAATALPASAQIQGASRGRVPAEVLRLVAELESDSTTIRHTGAYTVDSGTVIDRSIVVRNGAVSIAGEVRGSVVVLHGDLHLAPGAAIGGEVAVVDGGVFGAEVATIAGEFNQYFGGFGETPERAQRRLSRHSYVGHSEIEVGIDGNYNRVEGLPIRFGPELRTASPNPLHAYAYAIMRTEPGVFDIDDMGYRAAIEQRIPGMSGLWLGATAFSVNEPIDRWWFSDQEASLAAALYHEDVRDYYDRTGWMAYARFAPEHAPVDLTVGYAHEDHESAPLRDPWTLFNGGDSWRPLPLAAEGRLDLLHATGTLDLRRGSDFSTVGGMLRLQVAHALDGTVMTPAAWQPPFGVNNGRTFEAPFTAGLLDARGFAPIGGNVVAARFVAAGTVDGTPLPPAYQSALGGAGSLPGYASFSVNCGARTRLLTLDDDGAISEHTTLAGYGCDRVALFQAEFRADFGRSSRRDRDHDKDDDHHWWPDFDIDPDLILFFDAGRGWSYDDDGDSFATNTLYDAGAGVVLGGIGIFGAVPLTGDNHEVRFFLRLGPRF
jgi:hypothetical protein